MEINGGESGGVVTIPSESVKLICLLFSMYTIRLNVNEKIRNAVHLLFSMCTLRWVEKLKDVVERSGAKRSYVASEVYHK